MGGVVVLAVGSVHLPLIPVNRATFNPSTLGAWAGDIAGEGWLFADYL